VWLKWEPSSWLLYTCQFHNKRGIPWLAEEPKIQFPARCDVVSVGIRVSLLFWTNPRNVGSYSSNDTVPHPRSLESLAPPLREPEISRSQAAQERLLLCGRKPSLQMLTASLVNRKSDIHINLVISRVLQVSAVYISHHQVGYWFTQRVKGRGLSLQRVE